MSSAVPFRYDPVRAALIIVDVQNDFCASDGAVATIGYDLEPVQAMVPRLDALVAAARNANIPVVFVKTHHDESNDTAEWLGRLGDGPGTERTGITCRTGTTGADFYKIQPGPGDHVVVKNRFSAFVGTNLDILLRSLRVQSLLLTGVTTETCVESTLRDGLFRDYYVSLVEDCAASYHPELHAASAQTIALNFGTVIRSPKLLEYWAS